MEAIKKLAGQTVIYGMGTIVPRFLNYLLLTPFYTRLFEKGEYGIVTELYAYVALLLVILTYGMETTSFRFAETERNSRKVFSTAMVSILASSTFFILLIGLLHEQIAGWMRYESNSEYIIWMAIIVASDAFMAIPFARLRQQNKAVRFSAIKFIGISVNIGLNLLFLVYMPNLSEKGSDSFLLRFYNPEIGVGYAFIANLIAVGVTFLLLIRDIIEIKFDFSKQLLKKMLTYAWPLIIIGVAGMINEVADKPLMKYLLKIPSGVSDENGYVMEQIGVYGANTKIAVLMTIFIQMFKFAAEPFFFNQAKEKNSNQVYADVMKYFVVFCMLIFLGVTLFIDVVKYFIDEKFHEGLNVVPIILIGNMFLGVFYNLSVWYKLKDLTRLGAVIAIIGASITLLINFIFVPNYGYMGSAWGHLACYTVMMTISYLWGRRYLAVNYDLKRILTYMAIGFAIYVISLFNLLDTTWAFYLVNCVLFLLFAGIVFIAERGKLKQVFVG